MNSKSDFSTCEEMRDYFSNKIAFIQECIDLKSGDKEDLECLQTVETSVIELKNIVQQLLNELNEGHNQLTELKGLLSTMESLNNRLDHMQENFPAVLKPAVKQQPTVSTKSNKTEEVPVTPIISKQPKERQPTLIKCLTTNEFESVPKYMKGRIQYTQINDFINTFNAVITTKYKMLSAPRKNLKLADYKICCAMKSQDTAETKGKYFCTIENLEKYGNIKKDKNNTNCLTILRHCSRIKEVRGPGSFTRYVVMSS